MQIAILRKIHHPNTTQFLGACTKQTPYIVITELMACSLADAFQKCVQQALFVAGQRAA